MLKTMQIYKETYFFGFSLFFAIFGFSENFIKKVGQKLGSNSTYACHYEILVHLLFIDVHYIQGLSNGKECA